MYELLKRTKAEDLSADTLAWPFCRIFLNIVDPVRYLEIRR
jgi:hypothetical protein